MHAACHKQRECLPSAVFDSWDFVGMCAHAGEHRHPERTSLRIGCFGIILPGVVAAEGPTFKLATGLEPGTPRNKVQGSSLLNSCRGKPRMNDAAHG